MASFFHKTNAFNAGEISRRLDGRTDLAKYHSGCRELTNFLVLPQGGAASRPGTQFVAATKYHDRESRVIPFNYSVAQAYILEFGHEYVRFHTAGGGRVLDGEVPYEVETPYQESEVFGLQFVQSADVLYLVHPNHEPAKLSRFAHTDWRYEAMRPKDGPFLEDNLDEEHTLEAVTRKWSAGVEYDENDWVEHSASYYVSLQDGNEDIEPGVTADWDQWWELKSIYMGEVVLNAPAGKITFNPSHVGSLWSIRHVREDNIISGSLSGNGNSARLNVRREWQLTTHGTWSGILTLQRSPDGGENWENYRTYSSRDDNNIQDTGIEDEDVLYRLRMSSHSSGTVEFTLAANDYYTEGTVRITKYVTEVQAEAEIVQRLGAFDTSTSVWAEGAWNPYRGYPSCIAFFEQRLLFASTTHQKQTIWGSRVGDWQSFELGVLDDSAVAYTIAANRQNPITWLAPKEVVLVGTLGGEWRFGASDPRDPLTPTDVSARQQSQIGSVAAVNVDDVVLYIDRQRARLREMAYDYNKDAWISPDMSILAEHLMESGLKEMTWHEHPYRLLWVVRNDGTLLSFTYQREHEVAAWARHITEGGAFESVATVPGRCGDEAWFVVQRDINNGRRYIEFLQPPVRLEQYVLDTLAPWGTLSWAYTPCAFSPNWQYDQCEYLEGEDLESTQYDNCIWSV